MAPWAIARDRSLAFVHPDKSVMVKGNPHAIEDAIRNLVENAVAHSPALTEVTVSVDSDGSVSVADRGHGISPEDSRTSSSVSGVAKVQHLKARALDYE